MQNTKKWEEVLGEGEQILWEGRPFQGLVLGIEMIAVAVFVSILFLAVFGLAWALSSQTKLFWPVVIGGGLLSLIVAVGMPLFDIWQRRQLFYAVTNKRALQHGPVPDRIKSIPIKQWTDLNLIQSKPPSVEYARTAGQNRKSSSRSHSSGRSQIVGFWRINDAAVVYQKMIELKESQ